MSHAGYKKFNRPPRIQPVLPKGSIDLPMPPQPKFNWTKLEWITLALPVILLMIPVGTAIWSLNTRTQTNPIFLIGTLAMSLGFAITNAIHVWEKISEDKANFKEYAELLEARKARLTKEHNDQRKFWFELYPTFKDITEWPDLKEPAPTRLWERRVQDNDFLHIRLGLGKQDSSFTITDFRPENFVSNQAGNEEELNKKLVKSQNYKIPQDDEWSDLAHKRPWQRQQYLSGRALEIYSRYQTLQKVPIAMELNQLGSVGIAGKNREAVMNVVRALICQITAHHSSDEVKIIATYHQKSYADWNWVGWLPHTWFPNSKFGELPALANRPEQISGICSFILNQLKRRENLRFNSGTQNRGLSGEGQVQKASYMFPNLIWFVEDFELVRDEPAIKKFFEVGPELGIYLIVLADQNSEIPDKCQAIVVIRSDGLVRYSVSGENRTDMVVEPDQAPLDQCKAYALRMAPLKLQVSSGRGEGETTLRLLEMLNQFKPGQNPNPLDFWIDPETNELSRIGKLVVPIGRRALGDDILYLDLYEKVHGPHGLIAGTTGSGKSVLLQTVVAGLALLNSPLVLNFILGDFKGGGTFEPFRDLPHVVGMMSDLDLPIVERAMTALYAEIRWREHLLKKEKVSHIRDYQRKKNPIPEQPLPYLLVIIDEFAEMKEHAPDFMDRIASIARTGRTLGIYLLLATQRPAGVVTGQLNSNIKLRICLRVETPEDSSDMLGRKDAYLLPNGMPGRGFFKVGTDVFDEFQVARTDEVFVPSPEETDAEKPFVSSFDPFWIPTPLFEQVERKKDESEEVKDKDFNVISQTCKQATHDAKILIGHKPWQPPLNDPLEKPYDLPAVLGNRAFDPSNPQWFSAPIYGHGRTPIALQDNVPAQKQTDLMMDLLEQGSYCVSGFAGAGKSTLLQTMVTALAVTHAPDDITFYLIDITSKLSVFQNLPHRTTYVSVTDNNTLIKVFRELKEEITRRRAILSKTKSANLKDYHAANQPQGKVPCIFMVFNGYSALRESLPNEVESAIRIIMTQGKQVGIHLVLVHERGSGFGNIAEQSFQISLHQGRDDLFFALPKTMIVSNWASKPGRGFVRIDPKSPPMEVQVYLPRKADRNEQIKELEGLMAVMQAKARTNPQWANLLHQIYRAEDMVENKVVASNNEPIKTTSQPEKSNPNNESTDNSLEEKWDQEFPH